jgi:hypothetical protein
MESNAKIIKNKNMTYYNTSCNHHYFFNLIASIANNETINNNTVCGTSLSIKGIGNNIPKRLLDCNRYRKSTTK